MSKNRRSQRRKNEPRTSWTPVADWYNGWVGAKGSEHHRKLAIPMVLDLEGYLIYDGQQLIMSHTNIIIPIKI